MYDHSLKYWQEIISIYFPVDEGYGGEPQWCSEERVALDVDHERHRLEGVHDAHRGRPDVGREGLAEIDGNVRLEVKEWLPVNYIHNWGPFFGGG